MKKLILGIAIILTMLLFVGCTKMPEEIKQEIRALNSQKELLQTEIDVKTNELNSIQKSIIDDKAILEKLTHEVNGDIPQYILTLELKQNHYSLSFSQQIKDDMNKVKFNISVDEKSYNQQEIGNELLKEFRNGSLFVDGNFGDWVITVVDKHTEYIKKSLKKGK